MPIPLLVPIVAGAAALISGGYGAKKGYDAYSDFKDANATNEKAIRMYEDELNRLNNNREKTNSALEKLGRLKTEIYLGPLKKFCEIYPQIRNIDIELAKEFGIEISQDDIVSVDNIEQTVIEVTDVVKSVIASGTTGALAGFGAFGGVGALATTAGGTSIGTLSGVAATNATLAWLGGGSLAAGGLGMAGGMAVLGGLVTGPILAVAGKTMSSRAEKAKYDAKSNLTKVITQTKEMDVVSLKLTHIRNTTDEYKFTLEKLGEIFNEYVVFLNRIVQTETDFKKYNDREKCTVYSAVELANSTDEMCRQPILNQDGDIMSGLNRLISEYKELLAKY